MAVGDKDILIRMITGKSCSSQVNHIIFEIANKSFLARLFPDIYQIKPLSQNKMIEVIIVPKLLKLY